MRRGGQPPQLSGTDCASADCDSRNRRMQKVNFPASLAKPFRPGH